MKIAHVFPSGAWGGAEIYTVFLAAAQKAAGLDVVVWGKADSPMIEEAKKCGIPTLTDYLPYRLGLRHTRALARVIDAQKITHLHCHWSGAPWSFFRIKKYVKVNLIYHIHMWISVNKIDPFHRLAYRQLDVVIVAGERARKAALSLLPVKPAQLRVCPYMMDHSRLKNLKTTREDWNWPKDKLIFGMFSRLDPQKGAKEFALSLAEVLPQHESVAALLMGDPTRGEAIAISYGEEVEQLIKTNRASERFFRLPFRTDYLEVMKNCDVVVAPSYNESYSLAFLDAFALGKPVLSTNAGGTPDLIDSTRGWLIEPKSVPALTAALKEIVSQPNEIAKRGQAGLRYVRENHFPEAVLDKLMDVYASGTLKEHRLETKSNSTHV